MNKDFITFTKEISWFIKKSDKIDFLKYDSQLHISEYFQNIFPVLTELLINARILNLRINNQFYKLFSWTNKNDISFGWLNLIEEQSKRSLNLISEHKLLLTEIGGIKEAYNQPASSLSNNQNFLFIESECSIGIGDWDEYYRAQCNEENKPIIEYKDYICFTKEANGNKCLYNSKNKHVYLFAHDHSFQNVKCLENQPEYTFYKIDGIVNFVDYVETLASEWKNNLK
ncbi:hypothetical protein [Leptospira kanakyensis]|uniref:Uncharacterized protein n=1 Tax=Leptospira kanakyensis TaxID=2484968 RepID=A0A6N4Q164_9LEPT|nr:hypothetical protein [Leptospira kanakyensis]TGK45962.1 hypothetical protein EHQ11_19640 [Leptospira kanakyensis]TGK70602.1 hypothetical protein EHQ18_09130 [Leptospira kanakyensis]